MYLKSIVIHGFKSFANKMKFEFREGITGIVGPNGSGKSNVADAVRWVLGEQSAKQLRGGNMQDVIFAGTETRKPQSYASVAITFDNSDHKLDLDYEEVTVTRRLYRSGESEYLINNAQVRLRDIHEIFYDTGIGQEGYSIIGQGQIDRILSGKPEERRELFDEAAGIVKFKKRKQASLKKLEAEHQDLVRVNDILQELNSQIGPLKKQSETAKIYLEEKQKQKDLDINLFVIDEERTELQVKEVSERLRIVAGDMTETKEAFDKTKTEYERIEQELEELDESITELAGRASRNSVLREQLVSQIAVLKEQIHTINISGEQYANRATQIERDMEERHAQLAALHEEMQNAEEDVRLSAAGETEAVEALAKLDREIESVVLEIERAKQEVIDVLQNRASVKGNMQRFDTMLEQLGIRRAEIGARVLRLKEDEQRASLDFSGHEEEVKKLQDGIREHASAEQEAEKKIAELSEALRTSNEALDRAQTGFHRDSSRLESLRSMAERYDGYGNGIRRIMEQKRRNPGIRGVVADLVDVPEQYETAIETALGGSIRSIVTDNEATAKYMIEFLKAGKLGRATFLPLTSIRGRGLSGREVLKEEGVIGTASSLVSAEEEYSQLVEHLLGRIVVVDTVDHAIQIGRRYRHSVYMVTLAGESFAPGGSITGGAFKNNDNLLGRKREIEELTVSSAALRKEADRLHTEIETIREERNSWRTKLAAEHEARQKMLLRLNTVELTRKQAEEQLQDSRISLRSLQNELQEIERQIQDVNSQNSGVARTLAESEDLEASVSNRAEELRAKETELRSSREKQAAALQKLRVEAAAAGEQKVFREETKIRLERELASLETEKSMLAASISSGGDDILAKQKQIEEVQKTIDSGEEEAAALEKEREELMTKKRSLSESHREFFEKRDELSDRMGRLDREHFRLTSQKEKFETGREERAAYMWEEYDMTPGDVRAYVLPEKSEDRAALRKELVQIKDTIRKLGHVNVNAIEEYKVVAERHTFLTAQHDDLIKSEETLAGIIANLDEGMRRQFKEKFAEIQVEFDKAFKELFGGGHGSIELDPDADLLEAGIAIIAHPPGKKLQNMMQLSGGEKALTAIALLFAIQNLKPSPFCLLDEIEAALDENNVDRFAQYLHKLTKNTQFIIITHRRGTMTTADRLYGITMQEKGVSTLVSVNLIEDELTK